MGEKVSKIELTRRLENAKKVMTRMIFRNSHDLRAPVCTIIGLLDILKHSRIGRQEQLLIKNLSTSIKRLDKIIHEINDELSELKF